jgi:hypothetical protein
VASPDAPVAEAPEAPRGPAAAPEIPELFDSNQEAMSQITCSLDDPDGCVMCGS